MKACTKCRIEKSNANFSKWANSKDGLQSRCKACQSEYRKCNAEEIAKKKREYVMANLEKILEYQREYKKANSEILAARQREYYKSNIERIAAATREYNKANPEKRAAHKRNRKAKVRNAEGGHNGSDILSIFNGQRGLCANCKTKLLKSGAKKYHVDHIMPIALGGSNWPENLQCLCPSCNLSKGAKHPDEWAKQNGMLL